MPRSTIFIAACALSLVFCSMGLAQDSTQSLGDIARKAQKDKANNKPAATAKVITNDDMPAGSSGTFASPLAAAPGQPAQPGAAGKSDTVQSPAEGFDKLQAMLDELDAMDRPTLSSSVLGGNTANFPGRAKWEEKLYTAKQTFVAENRGVLMKIKQIGDSAQNLKDVQDPNDPRAKAVSSKIQELVQESQQSSAVFQAVITEGKNMAGVQ